jgi:hypothetical protein
MFGSGVSGPHIVISYKITSKHEMQALTKQASEHKQQNTMSTAATAHNLSYRHRSFSDEDLVQKINNNDL